MPPLGSLTLPVVLTALVALAVATSPSPTPVSPVCTSAGAASQSGFGSVYFGSGYVNNLACNYTFTPTPGYRAQVAFTGSFFTETNYDFVRIYDTGSGSYIASLSGSINPVPGAFLHESCRDRCRCEMGNEQRQPHCGGRTVYHLPTTPMTITSTYRLWLRVLSDGF